MLDVFNITIVKIKDVLLNLKLGKAVGNDKISHNVYAYNLTDIYKLRNCLSENYKYI
jgi:hypothetical protein